MAIDLQSEIASESVERIFMTENYFGSLYQVPSKTLRCYLFLLRNLTNARVKGFVQIFLKLMM